jgi:hypothetical protein
VAAGCVRLGDWLNRPRSTGPDFWLPVTQVTQRATAEPMYRYETRDDRVLAYGFVTRADWPRA